MTKAIDLSALFADTELPFGHPVRNFDESLVGYSDFLDRYEPPPIDPPEQEIIHYGPSDSPLLRQRVHDCGLLRRPPPSYWLRRLPRARRRGPAGPERLPRTLTSLPAGNHRPGRSAVEQGGPEALPALWTGGMVTVRRHRAGR